MLNEESLQYKEHTGTAADIQLHTLKNSKGTKLILSNYGAAVVSLFVKDKNGRFDDVVLGYDDPASYTEDEYYMGTVVGRYANRIAGKQVLINGNVFNLTTKDEGYHQHGGKFGFNKKLFKATPFQQPSKSGLVLQYISRHLEEGFPGELTLEVIYTLDDDDALTVEYKAVSDKTTLINITQHSYFNLSGNPADTIDGHELKILSHYYLPVNYMQVPTGKLAEVAHSVFDFTQYKKIGADIFDANEQLQLSNGYDHSFVLEKKHTNHLKHAAAVREPLSGRKMEVYTTEPAVHFYSGNYLNNVQGKNGIVYNRRSGFCLETQHFPDAPNHAHFPSTILKAGEQFYSKTIFKFSAG